MLYYCILMIYYFTKNRMSCGKYSLTKLDKIKQGFAFRKLSFEIENYISYGEIIPSLLRNSMLILHIAILTLIIFYYENYYNPNLCLLLKSQLSSTIYLIFFKKEERTFFHLKYRGA